MGSKMKVVVLVDDEFHERNSIVKRAVLDIGGVVRDSGMVYDPKMALNIIRAYPEADFFLLDGYFAEGDCMDVLPLLTAEEVAKVICFSGTPIDWVKKLRPYGVRHFPGKGGKFVDCIAGTCVCER